MAGANAAISARFARFYAGAHSTRRKKLAVSDFWRGGTLRASFAALSIHYAAEVSLRRGLPPT